MRRQTRPSPLPGDYLELDFEIVKEYWNEYDLSDGNRIKVRIVLQKLVCDPDDYTDISICPSKPMYIVYADVANRGDPNNEPKPREFEACPKAKIKIKRSNEQFNIYRVPRNDFIIRLGLSVSGIHRLVNRFDGDGLPFYILNSVPVIIVEPHEA